MTDPQPEPDAFDEDAAVYLNPDGPPFPTDPPRES